jgi:hypothetical protein
MSKAVIFWFSLFYLAWSLWCFMWGRLYEMHFGAFVTLPESMTPLKNIGRMGVLLQGYMYRPIQ